MKIPWKRVIYLLLPTIVVFLVAMARFAQPIDDPDLNILKLGLGEGTVRSDTLHPGIDCGVDCDQPYASSDSVTLTATVGPNSTFAGWGGFCSSAGTALTCPNVPMDEARSVTAEFGLNTMIPRMTEADLTPERIRDYLNNPDPPHQAISTPARFIAALPDDFKQNWILMSRSESLQTGTARSPRILLASANARYVFTVGMTPHSSYPGSSPLAIEYMQWDALESNFRFHEIVLGHIDPVRVTPPGGSEFEPIGARDRSISIDDEKCSKCHSTRNVLNVVRPITTDPPVRGSTPGTDGIPPTNVGYKNKPNWDAYDSWGGAMPFNRDRIYQGSVEAVEFRHLFNLWNWRNTLENDVVRPIIEQLSPLGLERLQPSHVAFTSPHSIRRFINNITDDQHISFGFDSLPAIPSESDSPPPPPGSYFFTSTRTDYSFGDPSSGESTLTQRGRYVTLRHSAPSPAASSDNDGYLDPGSDEGRGVELFDRLTGLNAIRIAEELIAHQFATGSLPINVRPIALAISTGCVNTPDDLAPAGTPIRQLIDARNGFSTTGTRIGPRADARLRITTFAGLETETLDRRHDLPRRKADIQKKNLDRTADPYLANPTDGLIQYIAATSVPPLVPDISQPRLRQEIFRRDMDLGPAATTIPFAAGMPGVYVDREAYGNNTQIALFRYFLEPLGVSVDKWSMSVRGRSRGYNFADVFGVYIRTFNNRVGLNYLGHEATSADCTRLIADSRRELERLPLPPQVDPPPTYTDVQRIFNKSCIECHNGLGYPPYNVPFDASYLNLSEDENPVTPARRLTRSHLNATGMSTITTDPATSRVFDRITRSRENCRPVGLADMMPCGGPPLSQVDVETIQRWIVGGHGDSEGDPHIRTIDGTPYDFQSAGEFVLLRGENFEVQTRQTAVETEGPLWNDHTGLSSCVSLNTAVAIRVGPHRITYQPNPNAKDAGTLQLRVDGNLVDRIGDRGIVLPSGGRILPTTAPSGLQIQYPGGTEVIVTPDLWVQYQLWHLNIYMRNVRANEGIMGSIAPDNWLPALPDGTFLGRRPDDSAQRYQDLYEKFADAWRVTAATSLFDYAPGYSTSTFTIDSWPGFAPRQCQLPRDPKGGGGPAQPPLRPLPLEVARQHCAALVDNQRRTNCEHDVMVTGEPSFARTYVLTEQIQQNAKPITPELVFPEDDTLDAATTVSFEWKRALDPEGNNLRYMHCVWPAGQFQTFNQCVDLPTQMGMLGGLDRFSRCWWLVILLLICLVVVIVLYVKKRRVLLLLIAIVILIAIVFVIYFCRRSANPSRTVSALQPGKAYYWKVIVEDGKGGTTESVTRRFAVK
jgi:hypothetical protein